MKNKKRKNYKKLFMIISIIFLISISFYYFINDNRNNNFAFKFSKDLTASILKPFSMPYTYNKNTNKVSSEINKDLEKEVKTLKKTLDLNKTIYDKQYINASIIKRSTTYWYNIITINKGSKQGIQKGNAVINDSGLIGKVIKVNNNSSDVKLIISKKDNNYISAMFYINDIPYYGLIDEYDIKNNELYLKNVIGDFNIEQIKGTNVVTSGLSDSFSSGLLIGTIENLTKETYGISNTIKVKPSANFNNINILTVIVGEKQ